MVPCSTTINITMSTTASSRGVLDIPMRLIFTEDGVHYFTSQNRKISRFKLSDGVEEYGIHVVDFSPSTIQRMQLLGYLSKIELPLAEVISKRKGIIDLVKLLTYGMLYRQFDTNVMAAVVESDMIKHWNRHNIKNPIDYKTKINASLLRDFLAKHKDGIQEMKNIILEPVHESIRLNEHLQDEEKKVHQFLAEKFLDTLNPLVFFVLTIHQGSTGYFQLIRQIQGQLATAMERSSIPEYLALMMVELLVSMSMDALAATYHPAFLRDDNIYVLCRLSKRRPEAGDRAKMHFMISNKKHGFDEFRKKINHRISTNITGKSLKDFYENTPSGEQMNLGLYYLSYLSEACRKVGINFESFVNRVESIEQTTIHIVLTM